MFTFLFVRLNNRAGPKWRRKTKHSIRIDKGVMARFTRQNRSVQTLWTPQLPQHPVEKAECFFANIETSHDINETVICLKDFSELNCNNIT